MQICSEGYSIVVVSVCQSVTLATSMRWQTVSVGNKNASFSMKRFLNYRFCFKEKPGGIVRLASALPTTPHRMLMLSERCISSLHDVAS